MHIKHGKQGAGDAQKCAKYLLGELDASGHERQGVRVLEGDPHLVAEVADSLNFRKKYSSAIIAFHESDNPTDEQINESVDNYKKMAMAGMEEDRMAFSAVLHRSKKTITHNDTKHDVESCHVHIFMARVDLGSGKYYNPCPPKTMYLYDKMRDSMNLKYGWESPADPANARTCSMGHYHYKKPKDIKDGLRIEPNPKSMITSYLENLIVEDVVKNRADVVKALGEIGEVTRKGKDYITVKVIDENDKETRLRLRGSIYVENFSRDECLARSADSGKRSRNSLPKERERGKSAAEIYAGFEESCQKRANFNQKRYRSGKVEPKGSIETSIANVIRSKRSLFDHLRRNLGSDAILRSGNQTEASTTGFSGIGAQGVTSSELGGERRGGPNLAELEAERTFLRRRTKSLGDPDNKVKEKKNVKGVYQQIEGERLRSVKRERNRGLSLSRLPRGSNFHYRQSRLSDKPLLSRLISDGRRKSASLLTTTDSSGGALNDRNQSKTIRCIERAERINRNANKASQHVELASSRVAAVKESCGRLVKSVRRKLSNNEDELTQFKTEINLSQYLASKGFELDKNQSCSSYTVMRSGEKKYVISRAEDTGFYIFTDAKNPRFNNQSGGVGGSIIDAVQDISGKNLGQVRKELRSWVASPPSLNPKKYQPKISRTPVDFHKILNTWENAKEVENFSYFRSRNLSDNTIKAYSSNIKESSNGTLLFRHFTPESPNISGFEYKSKDYAGFAKGGRKGLCVFRKPDFGKITKLIITETALDALSKAELDGVPDDSAYISTGGNPSKEQLDQIRAIKEKFGFEIVMATDNDKGGELIRKQFVAAGLDHSLDQPVSKDWNQDLKLFSTLPVMLNDQVQELHDLEHENAVLQSELDSTVPPLKEELKVTDYSSKSLEYMYNLAREIRLEIEAKKAENNQIQDSAYQNKFTR